MAGPTKKELAKLKRLEKRAGELDDPDARLDHQSMIITLQGKYGDDVNIPNPYEGIFNKGGMPKKKKKVPAIAISVGMVEIPKGKGKAKMMRGGMANKKEHMYSNGGSVTDNLKPLPKGPKGKGVRNLPNSVQMNMGFDPKS